MELISVIFVWYSSSIAVIVLFYIRRNALVTDPYLRVLGADGVFAIGDCATIRPDSIHKRAKELFDQ